MMHNGECREDKNMNEYIVCCFCGKKEKGIGNNPWPVNKNEDDRCCYACNERIVNPARWKMMQDWFESDDYKRTIKESDEKVS